MTKQQFIDQKMFFACDEKQYQEGLKRINATNDEKMAGFDCCYFRASDKDLFLQTFKK